MKLSGALSTKEQAVLDATARYKTSKARVFGAVVHGSDLDGSDLDVLVDTLPGATLFDLGGLKDELHEFLGVPVDLLTSGGLPPHVLEAVLAEARPV